MTLIASALVIALSAVAACSALTDVGQLRQSDAERARLEKSPNWSDGQFRNLQPLWNNTRGAVMRLFESTPGEIPETQVPVLQSDGHQLTEPPPTGLRITWFGHSSTLVEVDGIKVLIDPIWSERPSPISWTGPRRFYPPPIPLADLPKIDVVLISHDHYDHLDASTIRALRDHVPLFIVPLGIASDLVKWGVPRDRIVELDWWGKSQVGGVTVTATPARHASGRINPESDKTLWSGFALVGPKHRVYYSGDSGLLPAMRQIGDMLGPFDVTMIEAGQYDADWPDWHLGPEQAIEAHRLVRGNVLIPVHWGLFSLAHHSWTEPVERILAAAACRNVVVLTPKPGQSVEPETQPHIAPWWPSIAWRTASERPVVATKDGVPSNRVDVLPCTVGARAFGS